MEDSEATNRCGKKACPRKDNMENQRKGNKKMDSTPHCSRVVPHPGSNRVNFGVRMRTGALRLIWSNPKDHGKTFYFVLPFIS
jgi:hypothetical protein